MAKATTAWPLSCSKDRSCIRVWLSSRTHAPKPQRLGGSASRRARPSGPNSHVRYVIGHADFKVRVEIRKRQRSGCTTTEPHHTDSWTSADPGGQASLPLVGHLCLPWANNSKLSVSLLLLLLRPRCGRADGHVLRVCCQRLFFYVATVLLHSTSVIFFFVFRSLPSPPLLRSSAMLKRSRSLGLPHLPPRPMGQTDPEPWAVATPILLSSGPFLHGGQPSSRQKSASAGQTRGDVA